MKVKFKIGGEELVGTIIETRSVYFGMNEGYKNAYEVTVVGRKRTYLVAEDNNLGVFEE